MSWKDLELQRCFRRSRSPLPDANITTSKHVFHQKETFKSLFRFRSVALLKPESCDGRCQKRSGKRDGDSSGPLKVVSQESEHRHVSGPVAPYQNQFRTRWSACYPELKPNAEFEDVGKDTFGHLSLLPFTPFTATGKVSTQGQRRPEERLSASAVTTATTHKGVPSSPISGKLEWLSRETPQCEPVNTMTSKDR